MEDFKNKDFNWHDKKMSQELRLNLIKDHYGERYKIINGGKAFFEEAEDPSTIGRAIANTIENDIIIRDRKESELKRSDADRLNINAGEDIYNTFINEFVDLKGEKRFSGFKKNPGDIFTKYEINVEKFAEFMTLSQKNTDNMWLSREQLLSGENNEIYELWKKAREDKAIEDAGIGWTEAGTEEKRAAALAAIDVTREEFEKDINKNIRGDKAALWRWDANKGKPVPQPGFDGRLLGAMSIYANHTNPDGNTKAMMNYAKNRFLYGKDLDKFQDPFTFYKAGPPTPYMSPGYGGEHQQSGDTGPGGSFEHQDYHPDQPNIKSIINQDYKFVKRDN